MGHGARMVNMHLASVKELSPDKTGGALLWQVVATYDRC